MSISKEAWFQLISKKLLMWHGTTTRNLRSILKEGLKTSGQDANFSWDTDDYDFSYATHGGVYLAKSLQRAWSFAEGNLRRLPSSSKAVIMLVGVQVETTSPGILIDEDDLTSDLKRAVRLGDSSEDVVPFLRRYLTIEDIWEIKSKKDWKRLDTWVGALDLSEEAAAFQVSLQHRIRLQDVNLNTLGTAITSALRSYVRYMTYSWYNKVQGQPNTPGMFRKFAEAVKQLSKELKAIVLRFNTLRLSQGIGYRGANRIVFIGTFERSGYKVLYSTSTEAQQLFEAEASALLRYLSRY